MESNFYRKTTGRLVALASWLVFASAAHADLNRLVVDGQLIAPGGSRAASLRLLCEPDPEGGAISIELWVPQAFKLKDFDYDDFEGPDAVAGDRSLSRLTVSGDGPSVDLEYSAAGWYSGEEPDTFVFGLSQLSHRQGKIATFLKAIGSNHRQLLWTQSAFDKSKRQLRATFSLDPAAVKRIHATVDVCLAAGAKSKAKPKH